VRFDGASRNVIVMPGGDGLGWPRLDVHFHVGSLVIGTFGGQRWMKHLRRTLLQQAATATSDAKARVSQANGKKGGRPRKGETPVPPRHGRISDFSEPAGGIWHFLPRCRLLKG